MKLIFAVAAIAALSTSAFAKEVTLTGEGNLNVDLTFQSMDDFSPEAVAKKVAGLDKILEARTQLSNLITYMDGKTGAEELITKLINDPALSYGKPPPRSSS